MAGGQYSAAAEDRGPKTEDRRPRTDGQEPGDGGGFLASAGDKTDSWVARRWTRQVSVQKVRTKGDAMKAISSFRDLDTWKVAMDVVELTYRVTAAFPDGERYGLVSQMRRASVSVPSNVAEGQAVGVTKWGLRHVVTAIASSRELETQLEIARRLEFIGNESAHELLSELNRLQRLLYGMRRQHRLRISASIAGLLAAMFLQLVLK